MRFTLIELLVVIAILLILISILLPALSKARDRGREIACMGNVKQVGYAFLNYADDSNGSYSPDAASFSPKSGYWPSLLSSYINNPYLFICPAHPENKTRLEAYKSAGVWALQNYYNPDYGYNWRYLGTSYGLGFTTPGSYGAPAKTMQISSPSNTITATDSVSCGNNLSQLYPERGYYDVAWIKETYSSVSNRHSDGCNVLWCDGHVSRAKLNDVYFEADNLRECLWDRN